MADNPAHRAREDARARALERDAAEPSLSDMTPEDLVALAEADEAANRTDAARIDHRKARRPLIDAWLMKRLTDGEVIVAPSGRVVFKEAGRLGNARVNTTAVDEYAVALADHLKPKTETVTRYATVGDFRAAAKARELPKGTRLATFLIMPPVGSVVRWRKVTDTLGGDE